MVLHAAEKLRVACEDANEFIAHCRFPEKYSETAKSLRTHRWLKGASETGVSFIIYSMN